MDREYHIFECLADGSLWWRGTVFGLAETQLKLQRLSKTSTNENFAIHLPTREFIFRADSPRKGPLVDKRVFQIAYTDKLRLERAAVLRSRGCGVISVIGNEAAKALLSSGFHKEGDIDCFIIGHGAPEQTRIEMVDWIKAKFPQARILALNAPNQTMPGADYNVVENAPEKWLLLVG